MSIRGVGSRSIHAACFCFVSLNHFQIYVPPCSSPCVILRNSSLINGLLRCMFHTCSTPSSLLSRLLCHSVARFVSRSRTTTVFCSFSAFVFFFIPLSLSFCFLYLPPSLPLASSTFSNLFPSCFLFYMFLPLTVVCALWLLVYSIISDNMICQSKLFLIFVVSASNHCFSTNMYWCL